MRKNVHGPERSRDTREEAKAIIQAGGNGLDKRLAMKVVRSSQIFYIFVSLH